MRIFDNSDDRRTRILSLAKDEALTDRRLTGPQRSCHARADDHDAWRAPSIAVRESTTCYDAQSYRAEIRRGYRVQA
jgi:hypothetical protein